MKKRNHFCLKYYFMKQLKHSSLHLGFVVMGLLTAASCKKEKTHTVENEKDSVIVSEQEAAENLPDSAVLLTKDSMINNAPKTKKVLETGVMREEQDRVIIRVADGQRLPFTIGEKFTENHDKLILKISDFTQSEITATIKVKDTKQNIRFNQIKFPDGSFDGPFGKKLTHTVKENGEVWLIIGKNNMAEGTANGDFSVTVE